jgi:putative endonuclease
MYVVYILRCADKSFYVGHTRNISNRLKAHKDGLGASYTSVRRPVTLAYTETHETRLEAVRRERQLKRWTREKKEALIRGDLDRLHALSVRRT